MHLQVIIITNKYNTIIRIESDFMIIQLSAVTNMV